MLPHLPNYIIKGCDVMATSSFTKNFVVKDAEAFERLLEKLENEPPRERHVKPWSDAERKHSQELIEQFVKRMRENKE